MYKEDVIYNKWKVMLDKKPNMKFKSSMKSKSSKRHKYYIDKPYIAPNTTDNNIVSYDEMKEILQKKLSQLIIKGLSDICLIYTYDGPVTVIDFEPLFNPIINRCDESVYNIRDINKINDLYFMSISETHTHKTRGEYTFTNLTKPNLPYYMRMIASSYYGIQSGSEFDISTSISVIINGSWKVHGIVHVTKRTFLSYIQNLYEDGIVKFKTYANIDLEYMTITCLIKDALLFPDCKCNILTDALEYNMPCRFRKILFDYLEDKDNIRYFEWLSSNIKYKSTVNFTFSFRNELINDTRTNIKEFVQQYRVRLLSAMNKYGDIINNTEDISL
jgi:hypothetical protein